MEKKRRYASAQFGADNPTQQGGEGELHQSVFGDLPTDLSAVDPSDLLRGYALPESETESADTPLEQQAVRTTIVGGRPPGSGKPIGNVPRGIEVLVKKASVDPAFEKRLIADPLAAAKEIELTLEPVERAMLQSVTEAQLKAIVAATEVPESHRRAFLGTTAAAMLIVLGGQASGTAGVFAAPGGVAPDFPDPVPEPPAAPPEQPYNPDPFGADGSSSYSTEVVRAALSHVMNVARGELPGAPFVDARFNATAQQKFRSLVANDQILHVYISPVQLKRWRTVTDATNYIDRAQLCQRPVIVLTAKLASVKPSGSLSDKTLETDLKIDTAKRATLRRALASTLRIYVPWETFKNLRTVDDLVVYVGGLALKIKQQREQQNGTAQPPGKPGMNPGMGGTFGNMPDMPSGAVSRGIRPDTPPPIRFDDDPFR